MVSMLHRMHASNRSNSSVTETNDVNSRQMSAHSKTKTAEQVRGHHVEVRSHPRIPMAIEAATCLHACARPHCQ